MSDAHANQEWKTLSASVLAQARADDAPCYRCGGQIDYAAAPNHPNGPTADHITPLGVGGALLTDQIAPAHRRCNSSHGARLGNVLRSGRAPAPEPPTAMPVEAVGDDGGPGQPRPEFDVPWLEGIFPIPDTGTWPRLISLPHPRAVGTYGWEVIERSERRRDSDPMVPKKAKRLRWWQKLVILRMYEHDQEGLLVWSNVVLSTSRQVGKSVLLREVALDRITQADFFGEAQLVLHVAKDLTIADEIQRPARQWAGIMESKGLPWHPVGNNGRWAVEFDGVMGRWLIRSQNAVYGFSASAALIDEGWAIEVGPVSEGIEPTMAEREQPQLLLVSTAHSKATPLMPDWREKAISQIESPVDTLIIEWSAPSGAAAEPGQVKYHRMASPHWDSRRQAFIGSRVNEEGFTEQWLNIWPRGRADLEMLVHRDTWAKIERNVAVPTSASAGHTLALYPDITQSVWHLMQAGMDDEQIAYLGHVASYQSMKAALEAVARIARSHPADLIIPRFVRGRVPKLPGIRSMIQASESDVAAATTSVKPMMSSDKMFHTKSDILDTQMPRAVVERYGDTIRITSKGSPGPVEAAKAAVLAVWWASRLDRPRAVVV
jgi:hypothetical protein